MTYTILVVDDTPENIYVLSAMLRAEYRVIFATSGEDALQTVRQQQIDLILLDVMMPYMDGYEVCRRLKNDITTKEIPVIFITTLSEAKDEAIGLKLGAVDYLHKPCHEAIVRLRVRMHIELHNQNMTLERLVRERTQDLYDSRVEIVRRLGRAAEYRDNETGMHVIRVSHNSRLLAIAAGISDSQANILFDAAPMHDIGKIGIPDNILLKPGKLNAEEWKIMKTHPLIGAEIIGEHSSSLLKMARSVAMTHHEKWDGTGYPHGLKGEDIPIEGRILTIVDVFDALKSERSYKHAWETSEVIKYLQEESGRSFDPNLLQLFFTLIPEVKKILQQYSDTPLSKN